MSGKPGRTAEQQHSMLQAGIDETQKQVPNGHDAVEAALRNQEVQALTLIALELRELRRLKQSQQRGVGSPGR